VREVIGVPDESESQATPLLSPLLANGFDALVHQRHYLIDIFPTQNFRDFFF
jgi:hypothetical protein